VPVCGLSIIADVQEISWEHFSGKKVPI
jgi:hypothetical protein